MIISYFIIEFLIDKFEKAKYLKKENRPLKVC